MELLKAVGAAVLLNLWFLVPFVQYMSGEKLRINSDLSQALEIADYPAAMAGYTKAGKSFYTLFMDRDCVGYAVFSSPWLALPCSFILSLCFILGYGNLGTASVLWDSRCAVLYDAVSGY